MINNFEYNNSNQFNKTRSDLSEKTLERLRFRHCTIDGYSYHIPPAMRKPQFLFFSLTVCYNTNSILSDSAINSLVEPCSANEYTLQIEFDDLYPVETRRTTKGVIVSLYREGIEEPLSTIVVESDTRECVLLNSTQPIEHGNYFILIANAKPVDDDEHHFETVNGCQRFYFQIIPHGHKLKHPVLTDGTFAEDKMLKLSLINANISTEKDCFSIFCYDNEGKLMTMSEYVPYTIHEQNCQIETKIETKEWWLDNTYIFIVLHNDEPFASFSFQLRDGKQTEETKCLPLRRNTSLYMQAKQTKENTRWRYLSKIAGFSEIRRHVLDLLCQKNKHSLNCAISINQPFDKYLIFPITTAMVTDSVLSCYDCKGVADGMEEDTMYPAIDIKDNQFVCLYHISSLLSDSGRSLLKEVETYLQENPDFKLILYGNTSELDNLFELSPTLSKHIPTENRWKVQPYTLQEQINECRTQIENYGITFSPESKIALIKLMTTNQERIRNWGESEITKWIKHTILKAFRERIVYSIDWVANETFFTTLEETDIQLHLTDFDTDSFQSEIARLNEMVGLTEVKKTLLTIFNRTRFDKARKQLGLPVPEKDGYHMIFTGNPGTGKTTVAKLIGNVFHSMGLLSTGDVIVAERSDMIGRYIGDTEAKMAELLQKAKGNVLFIDEAYTLCDSNGNDRQDYGCRALECLLTILTEKDPDMVVIMAGYEKEMDRMLSLNLGMRGRFPYKIRFEDYNADELYQMACNLLTKAQYEMTSDADLLLKETIKDTVAHKDESFHNARWVEQYVMDGIISAMSDRIIALQIVPENRQLFQTVERQDVEVAYEKMKSQFITHISQRKRIGFVA